MDGALRSGGSEPLTAAPEAAPPVTPMPAPRDELATRFDAVIQETVTAAGNFGIRWNEPEGRFVQALLGGMQMLNATSLRAERAFAASADAARTVAEAELRKVREVALAIEGAKQQARAAIELSRVEHEDELRRVVAGSLAGLMGDLRKTVVIREQSWNRDRARANIRAAGLWMLGVFMAGFGLCLWMGWSDSNLGVRCRSNLVSLEGGTYCLVSAAQPQATGKPDKEHGRP